MFIIRRSYTFQAAHFLTTLQDQHKCRRLHGHNYTIIFELVSNKLDKHGFVVDVGFLDVIIGAYIKKNWDHRLLNDVSDFKDLPTTSEVIAKTAFEKFFCQFPQLYSVTVKETDRITATYVDPSAMKF